MNVAIMDRRDELIPAARERFQKNGIFGIVPQRISQIEDVPLKNFGLHMRIRPNCFSTRTIQWFTFIVHAVKFPRGR